MSTTSSIFSFAQSPALLPQLAAGAKQGLEQAPRSFKSLQELAKFLQLTSSDFDETHQLATKILNDEGFQDHPRALQRLKPLAQRCVERLGPVEAALSDESQSKEILEPPLQEFCTAHAAFRSQYLTEYQRACPYEPFTILSRYPKSIRVYLTAFFNQLATLSPERYALWKQAAIDTGEALLPIFSRLAIHHLLENSQASVPELFPEGGIASLRTSYKALKPIEQEALAISLRDDSEPIGPNVRKLSQNIALFASSIQLGNQRRAFNGVLRFVYEEAAKSFALLDQIHLSERPKSQALQCRVVFLALLKQENVTAETLPLVFVKKEEVLEAYAKYQALTQKEREEFERAFLEERDDSDNLAVYSLLQDWKNIFFNWGFSVPLHLLAQIAYHRSSTYT